MASARAAAADAAAACNRVVREWPCDDAGAAEEASGSERALVVLALFRENLPVLSWALTAAAAAAGRKVVERKIWE